MPEIPKVGESGDDRSLGVKNLGVSVSRKKHRKKGTTKPGNLETAFVPTCPNHFFLGSNHGG